MAACLAVACAPVSAPALASLGALPRAATPTAVVRAVAVGPTATVGPTPAPLTESILPAEGGWYGPAACAGPASARTGTAVFVWPTIQHALSGKGYSLSHPGLDLAAEYGAPIFAADAGATVYAGWNSEGYGNLLIIDHGNGWHSLYAHLSQFNVACGDPVEQGQIIGLAGSTGNSTGPHLHFELRSEYGRVNPWNHLP
jgi:murein DD-endopeptidase MepM/ murein hydrolase activator NlpD